MDRPAPMCLFCTHYLGGEKPPKCDAFPRGIPSKIWRGVEDHRLVVPGDLGIRFEPIDEAAAERIRIQYGKTPRRRAEPKLEFGTQI